jgi:hypothetical protein
MPVELEKLAFVDLADMAAVLDVLIEQVSRYSILEERKEMAEELFTGMAVGLVREEFAEVHVMSVAGWSWEELQETPVDVVERMALYKAVTDTMRSGGTLDFGGSSLG